MEQKQPITAQQFLGDRAWLVVNQNEAEAEAWGATKATLQIEKMFIKFPPLLDNEVRVKTLYCGMCHTDAMFLQNMWQFPLDGLYPMIPGHEIVGQVEVLGETAKQKYQIGDILGFSTHRGTCGTCETCNSGIEQTCSKAVWTYPYHPGGYANRLQGDADWFHKIPAGMDLPKVAPLFCAGATVFSPLKRYVKPGFKVAIAGIGGLGHLALMFASRVFQNVEVTALSSRPDKEQECIGFGAHKFVVMNPENVQAHRNSYDFILFCASGGKFTDYFAILKPGGTLCMVGVPPAGQDLGISLFSLLSNKTFCGSSIASRAEIREMLEICLKHNIYPQCEMVPWSKANEWMDKLDKSLAKYRYVLDYKL